MVLWRLPHLVLRYYGMVTRFSALPVAETDQKKDIFRLFLINHPQKSLRGAIQVRRLIFAPETLDNECLVAPDTWRFAGATRPRGEILTVSDLCSSVLWYYGPISPCIMVLWYYGPVEASVLWYYGTPPLRLIIPSGGEPWGRPPDIKSAQAERR